MKDKNVNGNVAKKSSKKPLVAVALVAVLALGGYGASQYLDKNEPNTTVESTQEQEKEKVNIKVSAKSVTVNGQEQQLADGQSWKAWLEAYFAKKDMSKTEVVVDFDYGDYDLVKEIKDAMSELKINTTETKSTK